jgi:hypothetical protein
MEGLTEDLFTNKDTTDLQELLCRYATKTETSYWGGGGGGEDVIMENVADYEACAKSIQPF